MGIVKIGGTMSCSRASLAKALAGVFFAGCVVAGVLTAAQVALARGPKKLELGICYPEGARYSMRIAITTAQTGGGKVRNAQRAEVDMVLSFVSLDRTPKTTKPRSMAMRASNVRVSYSRDGKGVDAATKSSFRSYFEKLSVVLPLDDKGRVCPKDAREAPKSKTKYASAIIDCVAPFARTGKVDMGSSFEVPHRNPPKGPRSEARTGMGPVFGVFVRQLKLRQLAPGTTAAEPDLALAKILLAGANPIESCTQVVYLQPATGYPVFSHLRRTTIIAAGEDTMEGLEAYTLKVLSGVKGACAASGSRDARPVK
jgi:hypothetical protein